jgi:hypothetical protein
MVNIENTHLSVER